MLSDSFSECHWSQNSKLQQEASEPRLSECLGLFSRNRHEEGLALPPFSQHNYRSHITMNLKLRENALTCSAGKRPVAMVVGRHFSTLTHPILRKKVPIKKCREGCSPSVPAVVVVRATGRQGGSFGEVLDRRTGFSTKSLETDKTCGEKPSCSSQTTTGVYFDNVELGNTTHLLQLGRAKVNSNDLPLRSVIGHPLLPAPLLPKGLESRRAVKVETVISSRSRREAVHHSQKISSLAFRKNGFKRPVLLTHFTCQRSCNDMSDDEKLFVEAALPLRRAPLLFNEEAPKTRSAPVARC